MSSKSEARTKSEKRKTLPSTLAKDLVESIRQMKSGQVHIAFSPVARTRERLGLSQSEFSKLLGVSVRTLQGWEQGYKQPSGAARTLLLIADRNPQALLDVRERLSS